MANTSPPITRSGKKRLLEGDNIAKKHLVRKYETSRELRLSKEEQKLLTFDYWYRPKIKNSTIKALAKQFYSYAVPFVRKACNSIRTTENEDMADVLKDDDFRRALFHLAGCTRQMKEYSLCMRAIRTDLSRKLKIDRITAFDPYEETGPSTSPGELDTSKKRKCRNCSLIHARVSLVPSAKPRELETSGNGKAVRCSSILIKGDDQFSIKVYNLLLILNEMLTQMGFRSKDVEGCGHTELTELIHDHMSVLKNEIEQEETLLIELIKVVNKSKRVTASDLLRSKLTSSLLCHIHGSAEVLSSNKEIYSAFKKLIDLMHDIWRFWRMNKNERNEKECVWGASYDDYLKTCMYIRSSSPYFPNK